MKRLKHVFFLPFKTWTGNRLKCMLLLLLLMMMMTTMTMRNTRRRWHGNDEANTMVYNIKPKNHQPFEMVRFLCQLQAYAYKSMFSLALKNIRSYSRAFIICRSWVFSCRCVCVCGMRRLPFSLLVVKCG